MPRRRRGLIAVSTAVALGAVAVAWSGCQADESIGCDLVQEQALAASPLTLLAKARLDHVLDTNVLVGADADRSYLRWGTIDATSGQVAGEQAATVDTTAADLGLWFALAGAQSPGDTVLAGLGHAAANGQDEEIRIMSLPADGSPGPALGPVLATIPGGATPGPSLPIAMGTSRLGMIAGLAWVDVSKNGIMFVALSASGEPLAPPYLLDTAMPPTFRCLAFVPGKNGLTLGYYKFKQPTDTEPNWTFAELKDDGSLEMTLMLPIGSTDAGCPLTAATGQGYALAWQDQVGTWQGIYAGGTDNRFFRYAVVASSSFGGPDLQPPLAGFGPVAGGDFAVVFQRIDLAELWRLDVHGNRRPGSLGFPSQDGDMGTVSSVPVAGSLYSTYADYTATDAGVGVSGRRYFLRTSCN